MTLPVDANPTHRTPTFTEQTIPNGLLKDHSTKTGVWGAITVERGSLLYCITEPGSEQETVLTPSLTGLIEPGALHYVRPLGPVAFYVQFFERSAK